MLSLLSAFAARLVCAVVCFSLTLGAFSLRAQDSYVLVHECAEEAPLRTVSAAPDTLSANSAKRTYVTDVRYLLSKSILREDFRDNKTALERIDSIFNSIPLERMERILNHKWLFFL